MFTKKLITALGVIAAILSLIGGIWAFDSHYATDEKVDEVKIEAKEDVEELEIHIAGALQRQEQKSDVKFYQFMYEKLTQELNNIKRQMRRFPDDPGLRQDYQEVLQERNGVKQQMNDAMRKIQ